MRTFDDLPILDWHNLYDEGWQGEITPEAFAHPAKFSRRLIRKMYEHALEQGYLKAGDHVVDPFGGVALGALDAMRLGLHWLGCELEPRFVEMGRRNIELWNDKYGTMMPGWGSAALLQGDSRKLSSILVNGAVTSPPFAGSLPQLDRSFTAPHDSSGNLQNAVYGDTPGQLGAMTEGVFSSPPFSPPGNNPTGQGQGVRSDYNEGKRKHATPETEYGETPGQLGSLNIDGLDAVLSSPPYEALPVGQTHMTSSKRGDPNDKYYRPSWTKKIEDGFAQTQREYGITPGQLGDLEKGGFEAVLSSPPYSEQYRPSSEVEINVNLQSGKPAGGGPFKKYESPNSDGSIGFMAEGDIQVVISSPPFVGTEPTRDDNFRYLDGKPLGSTGDHYGTTAGQLGGMAEGVISSPPFEQSNQTVDAKFIGKRSAEQRNGSRFQPDLGEYGQSEGQLGNLSGGYDASVTSPPFLGEHGGLPKDSAARVADGKLPAMGHVKIEEGYGTSEGNLGDTVAVPETFWQAAREIVEQVYTVLTPGGYTFWVCKDFVRKGKRVPFSDQWLALCAHVGFVPVERARAWVVKYEGTQLGLFGDDKRYQKERKSFFRRLAEAKGSPRIDWEDVLILRKPL